MRRLRIGIDGYNLAIPKGTGVATYGYALARTLIEAGHHVEGLFGLAAGDGETGFIGALMQGTPKTRSRADAFRLFSRAAIPFLGARAHDVPLGEAIEDGELRYRLPAFARVANSNELFALAHRHFRLYRRFVTVEMDDPPEIMHWTYPVPVTLKGARNIYTLHDLVPLRLPYTTLERKPRYYDLVQGCIDRAAHICTVSDASRRDILDLLDAHPSDVTNTYQTCVPVHAKPLEEWQPLPDPLSTLKSQGYFLFFGAIEPKKNVGRLLEAYLGLETETPLVIVGPRAWQSDEELRLLPPPSGHDGSRRVIHVDFLPRDMLLSLIGAARAVLFPSLYEGFGLPVLEALQLGTPVLTSETSSLPEVAGDAALFVDPYSVVSIAAGLRQLDGDAALRQRLAAMGPQQVDAFSQARYLVRLENMYARALTPP